MGVFGPILLYRLVPRSHMLDTIFMIIKQFGTGIIISTAFVHVSAIVSVTMVSPLNRRSSIHMRR